MYRTVVTICTTSLTFSNSTFCSHSVFMCFVWISEQTAIISLYNLNWLVFITQTESVYCAVRTGCLKTIQVNFCLWQGFDHEPSKGLTQDSFTDWVTNWMDDWRSFVKSLWLLFKGDAAINTLSFSFTYGHLSIIVSLHTVSALDTKSFNELEYK